MWGGGLRAYVFPFRIDPFPDDRVQSPDRVAISEKKCSFIANYATFEKKTEKCPFEQDSDNRLTELSVLSLV